MKVVDVEIHHILSVQMADGSVHKMEVTEEVFYAALEEIRADSPEEFVEEKDTESIPEDPSVIEYDDPEALSELQQVIGKQRAAEAVRQPVVEEGAPLSNLMVGEEGYPQI